MMWCDECKQAVDPREEWYQGAYEYDACPICGNQLDPMDTCPICGEPKRAYDDFCPSCVEGISKDVWALLDKWRPQGGDLNDVKYLISEIMD